MSEEKQIPIEELVKPIEGTPEVKVSEPNSDMVELQKQILALQEVSKKQADENQVLLAHKNEILAEKKVEKEKVRLAEEQKLRDKGDFETISKIQEAKFAELEKSHNEFRDQISNQHLQMDALTTASTIADGDNAKHLAALAFKNRLRSVNGQTIVLDTSGNPSILSLADLAKEIQQNPSFKSLLRGLQSKGGSATGDGGGATSETDMTHEAFNAMTPTKQVEFAKGMTAGTHKIID